MEKIFLIPILVFSIIVSNAYAGATQPYSDDSSNYCEPSTGCGHNIDTIPGKPVDVQITVKNGIPATVKIRYSEENKGIVTLEEKTFTGSFSGSYIPVTDSIDISISSASKDNLGIEYELHYSSYHYPYSNQGGCLIATATYGTELAPQVQQLRELRDNYLLKTESGSSFMAGFNELYYSFSPVIADLERQSPTFKEAVKLFITPMISSLSILNYVDMDSEAEVLGYGISLIVLNVGMYFVAPVGIVVLVRRYF